MRAGVWQRLVAGQAACMGLAVLDFTGVGHAKLALCTVHPPTRTDGLLWQGLVAMLFCPMMSILGSPSLGPAASC
jgi:hypothetical protein